MSKCCFCKDPNYKGYVVLLSSNIECFLMEEHIRDIYYSDDPDEGVCEPCRKKEFYDNPVWRIRAWLTVRCQIELTKSNAKDKGEKKLVKDCEEALKRINKYEKILEKTPEVKKLYMENNPAMFKKPLKEKKKCTYCGENDGQVWINDPSKIDDCMVNAIRTLSIVFKHCGFKILSCCCGHNKYPMSIVYQMKGINYELFSAKIIPRKRNFYKKDSEGYYYIPETIRKI